jgi:integrase
MAELVARDGVAPRALAWTILTAARSGETRGMTWSELDLQAKLWTIPASRMKSGRDHRVPLSDAASALLGEPGRADELVFSGRRKSALSDMSLAAVIKRMNIETLAKASGGWVDPLQGGKVVTVHGMRSSFRDWAGEATGHPREVVEAALAHRLGDAAEQAYARGDLFAKRRQLMADWAAHVKNAPRASSGKKM